MSAVAESMLSKVVRGSHRGRARKTLVAAAGGEGKSTFASQFPNPIFLDTEHGLGDIDCASIKIETFDEAQQALAELYKADHDFGTVVIDTVDWLERMIQSQVCSDNGVDSVEEIKWAKGHGYALKYWSEILSCLGYLRREKHMDIVLLSHVTMEKVSEPTLETFTRWSPKLHRTATELIIEWCDEVFYGTSEVHVIQDDEGFDRKRNRAIGGSSRVLHTVGRPGWRAKHRMDGLPDKIKMEFADYAQYREWPDSNSKAKKTANKKEK